MTTTVASSIHGGSPFAEYAPLAAPALLARTFSPNGPPRDRPGALCPHYPSSTSVSLSDLRRPRRRGVPLLQRRRGARLGLDARRQGLLLPGPAPRPQYRLRHGRAAGAHGRVGLSGGGSGCRQRRLLPAVHAHHLVAWLLLG